MFQINTDKVLHGIKKYIFIIRILNRNRYGAFEQIGWLILANAPAISQLSNRVFIVNGLILKFRMSRFDIVVRPC
jgi:hypothetical protein